MSKRANKKVKQNAATSIRIARNARRFGTFRDKNVAGVEFSENDTLETLKAKLISTTRSIDHLRETQGKLEAMIAMKVAKAQTPEPSESDEDEGDEEVADVIDNAENSDEDVEDALDGDDEEDDVYEGNDSDDNGSDAVDSVEASTDAEEKAKDEPVAEVQENTDPDDEGAEENSEPETLTKDQVLAESDKFFGNDDKAVVIKDLLFEIGRPATTAELVDAYIAKKNATVPHEVRTSITNRVTSVLTKMRDKRQITNTESKDKKMLWTEMLPSEDA